MFFCEIHLKRSFISIFQANDLSAVICAVKRSHVQRFWKRMRRLTIRNMWESFYRRVPSTAKTMHNNSKKPLGWDEEFPWFEEKLGRKISSEWRRDTVTSSDEYNKILWEAIFFKTLPTNHLVGWSAAEVSSWCGKRYMQQECVTIWTEIINIYTSWFLISLGSKTKTEKKYLTEETFFGKKTYWEIRYMEKQKVLSFFALMTFVN